MDRIGFVEVESLNLTKKRLSRVLVPKTMIKEGKLLKIFDFDDEKQEEVPLVSTTLGETVTDNTRFSL